MVTGMLPQVPQHHGADRCACKHQYRLSRAEATTLHLQGRALKRVTVSVLWMFRGEVRKKLEKSHLWFVDKDFLRSGRLPNVPDADDSAAVKTHSAGLSCRAVDWHHGVPLDLREVHQAGAATCNRWKMVQSMHNQTHLYSIFSTLLVHLVHITNDKRPCTIKKRQLSVEL